MRTAQEILQAAQAFAEEELRPQAGAFEAEEEIPREVIRRLAQQGFLAASFPVQYGGLALDPVEYGLFTEEIGKACNSMRELITVHTSLVGESLLRWGTPAQKEHWLPKMARGELLAAFALTEPDVGSDARGVRTTYVKTEEGFLLQGRKKWISFADIADLFLVIASDAQTGEVTAFLVERSQTGVSTTKMSGLLASKASHLAEIDLHDVVVPHENVLGRIGGGFSYIVNSALDHGRYSIAWAGVAIAQESLNAMATYARTRRQGGKLICEYDAVQALLADAHVQLQAARALCLSVGRLRKDKHHEAMIQTSIAKVFTSKMAMKVATDAVQVFGGNGFSNQYPVERLFREAKVLEIIEGTSQVLQPVIAQQVLRTCHHRGAEA
ncbi:acyl-CoA dehydrogenase family protein [Tumebacillus sp. ITR2]|uniref:Acyl-CoA dehydrogenase family protein n=1 Tax=Tumebacillus amylolyticus TaxID=2801339 RepID=A0ABS1JEK3_9BACL|nr:acyl-CoA dehydrogenase family protein [Tumebacillus amylolyticus]MBL0388668.1 acyl-CoA dehydrogenase family protein [Tumebacillus amylolyticus]